MLARAISFAASRATRRYREITDLVRHRYALAKSRLGLSKHPDQCYSHRTYAQSGEDQIVLGIFNLLGIAGPAISTSAPPDGYPDFMSIDTEGLDDAILAAADFSRSSPKVICVERATDQSVAARDVLCARGYVAYVRTWANMIMVREDAWQALRL